ncbi:member of the major facilitator superfamily [Mycena alexandri]|uniref:Member of the major facilitator superfamily n=1 Tax=Mycena alexandri TaxID=1745969 RepID=A0AAD6SLF5_9AGAR|nr:member of the major facilitator superfamily [Mycena alexandri]
MPDETSALLGENANSTSYGNVVRDVEEDLQQHKPQVSLPMILLPMAIGIFLGAMDQTIVISSYAAIGSELNQLQNTSWIATAYMMTLTSFQPLYGKMSDIFGRKPCLLFAYTVFALGSLCCSLSKTLPQLIFARGIAGIGGGGMSTVVSIIMSDIVPLRSRGTWQGIINIVYASGSAAGAPLGGFLSDTIGWRWGFLFQVPVIIIAFIIVSFALHLPQTETSDLKSKLRRVDFSGALSLVLCVFFLLFGLDRGGNITWNDEYTILALSAFAVFFVIFASVELAWAAEPFAPRRIIAHPSLIGAYMVNFFALMSSFSMLFHVSLFYQAVLGKSPSEVGFWLLPTVFAGATGRYYWLTFFAYVAMLVGMLATVLEAGVIAKSAIGVAVGECCCGLSTFFECTGVTTSLIALIANAGPADQAMATAVSYLFRSLGSVVGLSIGSTLLQVSLRNSLRATLKGDMDVNEIIRRVRESLTYIDELDTATAALVRAAYEHAVTVTMWFSTIVAGLALVSAAFIKEKPITPRAEA